MSSSGSSTSGLTRGVRGWRVAHRGAPSPVGCADGIQCADGRRNRDVEWFVQGRQNGVLRILPEDEGKPLILLSPAYWREINEPRSSDTGKSGD